MAQEQILFCTSEDCRYWQDQGSGCRRGSVYIQQGRCSGYEQNHRLCLCIQDGKLQAIYSDIEVKNIDVDIFDFDAVSAQTAEQMHTEADTALHLVYGRKEF